MGRQRRRSAGQRKTTIANATGWIVTASPFGLPGGGSFAGVTNSPMRANDAASPLQWIGGEGNRAVDFRNHDPRVRTSRGTSVAWRLPPAPRPSDALRRGFGMVSQPWAERVIVPPLIADAAAGVKREPKFSGASSFNAGFSHVINRALRSAVKNCRRQRIVSHAARTPRRAGHCTGSSALMCCCLAVPTRQYQNPACLRSQGRQGRMLAENVRRRLYSKASA